MGCAGVLGGRPVLKPGPSPMWAARRGRGVGRRMLPVDTRISLQLALTRVYFIDVSSEQREKVVQCRSYQRLSKLAYSLQLPRSWD